MRMGARKRACTYVRAYVCKLKAPHAMEELAAHTHTHTYTHQASSSSTLSARMAPASASATTTASVAGVRGAGGASSSPLACTLPPPPPCRHSCSQALASRSQQDSRRCSNARQAACSRVLPARPPAPIWSALVDLGVLALKLMNGSATSARQQPMGSSWVPLHAALRYRAQNNTSSQG